MSDTPKTDAAEFEVFDGQNIIAVVEAEFARELEREMNAMIVRRDLKDAIYIPHDNEES